MPGLVSLRLRVFSHRAMNKVGSAGMVLPIMEPLSWPCPFFSTDLDTLSYSATISTALPYGETDLLSELVNQMDQLANVF